MEHASNRFEDHNTYNKVESMQERINLQLEQWKIDIKKDILDMVMAQNREIWLRCQAELAGLREELQRVMGGRLEENVDVHEGVVSQGAWQQEVNVNAASSSCGRVGKIHDEAKQAAFDSFDYASQLCYEVCQNEFGYLHTPRSKQRDLKRVKGVLPASAVDRCQHQADPLMPRFVDLSELSPSTWIGVGAGANSTTQEAPSPIDPPPGFGQEDLGRGKHEKRQEIIQCIKLKSSYKEYALIRDLGEELPCEVPRTPDPGDESISKRKWESLVSKWRAALRQVEKIRNGMIDDIEEQ